MRAEQPGEAAGRDLGSQRPEMGSFNLPPTRYSYIPAPKHTPKLEV